MAGLSKPSTPTTPVWADTAPSVNDDYLEQAIVITAKLCRRFEGFYPKPYLCPAGVWTIGFGATYYENGVRVTPNDSAISLERGEQLLMWMLRTKYLPPVLLLCPGITHPGRLAALVDFAYNCGVGNLRSSTLRKKVNAGLWGQAKVEFGKWIRGGGRVLRGLVIRRAAEVVLI